MVLLEKIVICVQIPKLHKTAMMDKSNPFYTNYSTFPVSASINSQNFSMPDPNFFYLYMMKTELENQLLKKIVFSQDNITNIFSQSMPKNQIQSSFKNQLQKTQQGYNEENNSNSKNQSGKYRKNDTKNIPKNFGKAIITFVQKNQKIVKRILDKENVDYDEYLIALRSKKRGLNAIANLREIWCEEEFKYARVTRMISMHYLKKGSLRYVFNSRIQNHIGHIKYRKRLMDALRKPRDFTCIKTY